MRRRPLTCLVVTLLLVAPLAAACSASDDAESPSPTGPLPAAAPEVEVGDRLWGSDEADVSSLVGLAFQGDTAVVADSGVLAGVDAATGRERWRMKAYEPAPVAAGMALFDTHFIVGSRPGDPVLVNMASFGDDGRTTEASVVAIDPRDGTERWTWRAPAPDADGFADPVTDVVGAVDGIGIVVVGTTGSVLARSTATPVRTVALELATGRVLWERQDLLAGHVVGDRVVMVGYAQYGVDQVRAVVDLTDGETLWEATPEIAGLEIVGAADGLVVLLLQGDDPRSRVLDLDTGDVRVDVADYLRAGRTVGLQQQVGSFVAWTDAEGRLSTYAAGEEVPTAVDLQVETSGLYGVVGDYVVLDGDDGYVLVDRRGAGRSEPSAGLPVLLTDDQVVEAGATVSFDVLGRG